MTKLKYNVEVINEGSDTTLTVVVRGYTEEGKTVYERRVGSVTEQGLADYDTATAKTIDEAEELSSRLTARQLASTRKFESIEQAYEFANSRDGQDLLDEEFASEVYIRGACGSPVRLKSYVTPQAAALAALADDQYGEWSPYLNRFSVTSLYNTGGSTTCVTYAATLEHDGSYTHTDADGFLMFLNNNDWQDPEWQQPIL